MRKPYRSPVLQVRGDIREVTRSEFLKNRWDQNFTGVVAPGQPANVTMWVS
jgi:hypothetical protein